MEILHSWMEGSREERSRAPRVGHRQERDTNGVNKKTGGESSKVKRSSGNCIFLFEEERTRYRGTGDPAAATHWIWKKGGSTQLSP